MAERLIDAEAFLDFLRIEEKIMEDEEITFDYIRSLIVSAPTTEAKPIVHAHWNDDGRCTNCGEHAPFLLWADTWHESKYCHGCGAQMDEVVKIMEEIK